MNDIEQRVLNVLSSQLSVDVSQLSPEKNFIAYLGADSLDTVEIIMALEDELGIEIPDEEAEEITTVGKALDYARSKF